MKLISVIIPIFNAEKYLSYAIESILNQTHKNLELILIDDCSTDNSWNILVKYIQFKNVKVIKNTENLGVSKSMNIGINLAKGEYIARLDADDIAYSNRLLNQFEYLENNPSIGGVGGQIDLINERGEIFGKWEYSTKINDSVIPQGAMMIRADVYKKHGLYKIGLHSAEDIEFINRTKLNGILYSNLGISVIKYRIHGDNASSNRIIETAYNIVLINSNLEIPSKVDLNYMKTVVSNHSLIYTEVLNQFAVYLKLYIQKRDAPNTNKIIEILSEYEQEMNTLAFTKLKRKYMVRVYQETKSICKMMKELIGYIGLIMFKRQHK